jgi:signal transduction histidine kinase
VLICAPFGRDAVLIQQELGTAGLPTEVCNSVEELSIAIGKGAGAALIADEALRPQAVDCLAQQLAQQPPWSDFPVIIMTSGGATTRGSKYRLQLLEPLGNISLLERPLRSATLISSVRAALRARRHQYQLCTHLEEREAKEQALQRANRDLEQFAYSASHDLQEPLRMVSLYSQMLKAKYSTALDAEATVLLGHLVNGAKRMTTLLKDLLTYIQVVQGEDEMHVVTDSEAVLAKALANLDRAIGESGAEIEAKRLPVLGIDEVHLMQLFQNLIGNAIKYRGANKPRITIFSYDTAEGSVICVQDNGIGIDPQYREKVFGIFRRLHGADQYEGNGIGLALCQKIVERYGGTIWVESKGEGEGSTFCFKVGPSEG